MDYGSALKFEFSPDCSDCKFVTFKFKLPKTKSTNSINYDCACINQENLDTVSRKVQDDVGIIFVPENYWCPKFKRK